MSQWVKGGLGMPAESRKLVTDMGHAAELYPAVCWQRRSPPWALVEIFIYLTKEDKNEITKTYQNFICLSMIWADYFLIGWEFLKTGRMSFSIFFVLFTMVHFKGYSALLAFSPSLLWCKYFHHDWLFSYQRCWEGMRSSKPFCTDTTEVCNLKTVDG